jgi:hypothetical protein
VHHLARLVRPGGHVLLSENVVNGHEQRGPRRVNRSMDTIAGVLHSTGLEPVRRVRESPTTELLVCRRPHG